MSFDEQDFAIAILKVLSREKSAHKWNLVGRPRQSGALEHDLKIEFGPEERGMAVQVFERLRTIGLIRSTYADLVDPENWVEITEFGRSALATKVLDPLDRVLHALSSELPKKRRGAWAAIESGSSDAESQAAHSMRETIDQVLKFGAPDEEVRKEPGFQPDQSSSSGVTRRQRLRLVMKKFANKDSDNALSITEKLCDVLLAVDEQLKAQAHSRTPLSVKDVRDAMTAAEMALRRLLLP